MLFRISPSPEVLEDIEPLAKTKPTIPLGERWWMKCCTHAKFAFPFGGTPNFHLTSSCRSSPPQSLSLKGGFAMMKSALRSLCSSFRKLPWPFHLTKFDSIPLMAKFILHNRQVVWLLSWP